MGRWRGARRAPACRTTDVPVDGAPAPGAVLVWLPLCVLGATLFAVLVPLGFPMQQIAGADFRAGLAAAYFFAALTLAALLLLKRLRPVADVLTQYTQGMSGMLPIAATLVLAWALGNVSEQLGTGAYVAEIARDGVSGSMLPALVFLLAAVVSFATGSSWGTIVIMMPLAVPAALATAATLPVVIGAVLSGGLFGDHSSPVSETTLLSSTGADVAPLQHFTTQLPYAATNGAIALGAFLVAGVGGFAWVALLAVVAQIGVLLLIKRWI